jgi:hypothetical protein
VNNSPEAGESNALPLSTRESSATPRGHADALPKPDPNSGAKATLTDGPYPFPAPLVSLLIETIPLLCRTKYDTLMFFRAAGVSELTLEPIRRSLARDPHGNSKYGITRRLLVHLNEQGDAAIEARRRLLREVIDCEEYSTPWPGDRLKARGLVAEIRDLVNKRDSFTRIREERDEERRARLALRREAVDAARASRRRRQDLYRRLSVATQNEAGAGQGRELEVLVSDLFAEYGLLVREAFTLHSESGVTEEQIDGVISLDGHDYLVEVKCQTAPVDVTAISRHLVRLLSRGEVRGLIIATNGFTTPAVSECRRALRNRVIVLAELRELILVLEQDDDVASWLRTKTRAAALDRQPFQQPMGLPARGNQRRAR